MKNILYLLSGILMLSACKKDEEVPAMPLTLGETTYTISAAKVVDYGALGEHYNYDFYLAEGSLEENNTPAEGAKFYVYAELFSAGTQAFTTGSFAYSPEPLKDLHYFNTALVAVDSNSDGSITDADEIIPVTGGQVKVEGIHPRYTLTFSLHLLNGQRLSGRHVGTFDYESKR